MSLQNQGNLTDYKRRIAYHEAGHAAAILFNNHLSNLPPVFFQILLDDLESSPSNTMLSGLTGRHDYIARIKGGRLIKSLPLTLNEMSAKACECANSNELRITKEYLPAFEVDILNLFIGPVAEAKYVAGIDDEPFKHQLLTVQALKNYGGDADLCVVNEYLQSFAIDKQHEWMNHFLIQAFNFVNDKANWQAITGLAGYIFSSHKNQISREELVMVLDR